MTAIHVDLTRALRQHRPARPVTRDGWMNWDCLCGERVSKTPPRPTESVIKDLHEAHLAAVLAPIVAGHVAAGQESIRLERDRLAKWKAEAMPILEGLQELGQALGIGLGKRITGREAVDAALDLRNERDAARAAMKTTTKETS